AVPAAALLFSDAEPARAGALAELPGRALVLSADASTVPAALALVGAVLALVAAVTIARGARSAGGLSARYDSPAVRRERAEQLDRPSLDPPTSGPDSATDAEEPSERAIWDALDSGLDPTVGRDESRTVGRDERPGNDRSAGA
ncbi:MAG: Trp biosynthesis-associated membrane protein, partial [Rhodococcus sp. (in: high G+C Gram-positive bacteria)]